MTERRRAPGARSGTAATPRPKAGAASASKRPAVTMQASNAYDPDCTRCPRLASFLVESHERFPDYWSRPVPAFGDPNPKIVLVGLAPGLHGANRTGRPFTGDYAGILLYQTLFDLGLANQPNGTSPDDGLKLIHTRIINSVKCVPPENKPTPDEIKRCNTFLQAELALLSKANVLVALGRIAHEAALVALGHKRTAFAFGHGAEHRLSDTRWLIDSYHCSRYNTQTRRLTPEMFKAVLTRARKLADL
jgi:uracil-DNA glycosylase family 4